MSQLECLKCGSTDTTPSFHPEKPKIHLSCENPSCGWLHRHVSIGSERYKEMRSNAPERP